MSIKKERHDFKETEEIKSRRELITMFINVWYLKRDYAGVQGVAVKLSPNRPCKRSEFPP